MKMKKRMATVLAVIFTLMISIVTVSASGNITVRLNGEALSFDVQPQIINERTMVPMRKIFESLGAVVTWDQASQTATGKKGDTIVNITIDSKILFKNGVPKTLDVAPAIIDERTLVPVRAIAESFDCNVEWISETQTVNITTNENFNSGKTTLSASEIADRVAPSVFYIEVYDKNSKALGSGSGFFISSDGVAVTNYHVIEGSYSARITTVDGDMFNISNVIAFDENLDVAIIRVDKTSTNGKTVSGFPSTTTANSDDIKAGQTVYALGSPRGLQNTISNGIISNTKQIIGNETFIQITAPISHGSSGGALVNEYGEVIGITSAGIDDAENIGFAIPINVIKMFDLNTNGVSYAEFASDNNAFTLLVSPETVELEVGESQEILVYAEGKGEDWSIYWDTEQDYLVGCQWGDWLEDYDMICPLTITGLKEGVATITIYSDVDFQGKTITVYVKKPRIETYPSSCTNVPTYTAITGVKLIDYEWREASDIYTYPYYNIDTVQSYVDFLLDNGFAYYKKSDSPNSTQYMYISPEGELIGITLAHRWNEVWIFIPR